MMSQIHRKAVILLNKIRGKPPVEDIDGMSTFASFNLGRRIYSFPV